MVRLLILVFSLANVLHGAELTVFTSSESLNDDGASASVWNSDGSCVDQEPELAVIQEGQIFRQIYRNLKPGKYRIVLEPVSPIGFSKALMETHVNLEKEASESVILMAQDCDKLEFPAELVEAFKKVQGSVMWDLSVRYPGFKGKFYQVRTCSEAKDFKQFIHYLRSDGEYTIGIWGKDGAEGYAYEKTFRVAGKRKSEQPGTGEPANPSERDSQGGDKPQPESEGLPR